MKKIVLIISLLNSLCMFSQVDSESIDILKGISKSEESEINETNKLSLIYKTFDVRVSYKNEEVVLRTYELFPALKRVTKIKKVIILNAEQKEIITKDFDSVEAIINVQELLKGTYNIYIKTDNGQLNKQFAKK